jgi:rhodanese-related sulfurtransferase
MFAFSQHKPSFSAADAVKLQATGEITLVDIREHGEVQSTGKARGAIHLPLATLRQKADPANSECHPDLACGKPVVLYCASGGRASMAAQLLGQMGYNNVHNIGGLTHWQMAGGEIE